MQPVCEFCGWTLTREGWRGPVAVFVCSNLNCPHFGDRAYTIFGVESSEHVPDRKEGSE